MITPITKITLAILFSFGLLYLISREWRRRSTSAEESQSQRLLSEWGGVSLAFLEFYNVNMDCSTGGDLNIEVCCGLIDGKNYPRHKHLDHHKYLKSPVNENTAGGQKCVTNKRYVPSPYEKREIQMAWKIVNISTELSRRDALLDHFYGDIEHSNRWLERVKVRMEGEKHGEATEDSDDFEYLSRFVVSYTCQNRQGNITFTKSWNEWIEPLTTHARHPFSYANVNIPKQHWHNPVEEYKKRENLIKFPRKSIISNDYVLLHSGNHLDYSQHSHGHNHNHHHIPAAHYFIDAGTSTFDSSLRWFTCAYLNRNITFDHIYGFEYTLLEPTPFWRRVPPDLLPIYHFYNAPVSGEFNATLSAFRIIEELARKEDFVAFKLDIDTPEIEIPMVQQLVERQGLADLVDEFFFELHFRCELLEWCCWGKPPLYQSGFKMDRANALELFQMLRFKGIRAHIWP